MSDAGYEEIALMRQDGIWLARQLDGPSEACGSTQAAALRALADEIEGAEQ